MKKTPHERTEIKVAWLCIGIGVYISSIAFGWIHADADDIYVPMWVLFLIGVIFFLCGAIILNRHHSKLNSVLAAMLIVIMGGVGAWVAIFGADEGMSGGIPFIPSEYNYIIARIVFGAGALMSLFIAAYAVREIIKKVNRPTQDGES